MGSPVFGCQGSVVEHWIDHDADTLAEHTFDRKGRHTIGTESLGSAQCFQGIASESWRENALAIIPDVRYNAGHDETELADLGAGSAVGGDRGL